MNTTPTTEQIDNALTEVAAFIGSSADARRAVPPPVLSSLRLLVAAIPALRAERDTLTTYARHEAELCVALRNLALPTDPKKLGEAIAAERADAAQEREEHTKTKMLYGAAREAAQGLGDQVTAWQAATGCPTPEDFAASKINPNVGAVEHIASVLWAEFVKRSPDCFRGERSALIDFRAALASSNEWAGIVTQQAMADARAVISALAKMGAEMMPSHDEIANAWYTDQQYRGVRRLLLSRLAPVLGARMAWLPTVEEIAAVLCGNDPANADEDGRIAARAVIDLFHSRDAMPFASLTDTDRREGFVADASGQVCSLDGHVLLRGDPATAKLLVDAYNTDTIVEPTDEELAEEARFACKAAAEKDIEEMGRSALIEGSDHLVRGFICGRCEGRR